MTKNDIIFSLACGLSVSWIALDFFGNYGWVFIIIFPALSVLGLWIADLIGRRFLFARQAGKFVLAGAFADVIDIKIFQLLFLFAPFSLFFKAISFCVATIVKYFCDKHWTFEKHEGENAGEEIIKFFLIAGGGLAINVVSFYFFGKIRTGLPDGIWTEADIIISALIAGTWNFCGYKFLVFKK